MKVQWHLYGTLIDSISILIINCFLNLSAHKWTISNSNLTMASKCQRLHKTGTKECQMPLPFLGKRLSSRWACWSRYGRVSLYLKSSASLKHLLQWWAHRRQSWCTQFRRVWTKSWPSWALTPLEMCAIQCQGMSLSRAPLAFPSKRRYTRWHHKRSRRRTLAVTCNMIMAEIWQKDHQFQLSRSRTSWSRARPSRRASPPPCRRRLPPHHLRRSRWQSWCRNTLTHHRRGMFSRSIHSSKKGVIGVELCHSTCRSAARKWSTSSTSSRRTTNWKQTWVRRISSKWTSYLTKWPTSRCASI